MPTLFFEGEIAHLQDLNPKLEKIIKDAAEAAGYELIEWMYISGSRGILRVYIDKADRVTIEDCGRFSAYLGSIMDIEDPIPYSYVLEVSSPGVNRPIKTDKDYQMAKSKWVIIVTKEAIEGKREFAGNLQNILDDYVEVEDSGKIYQIKKEYIVRARLDTPVFSKR